MSLSDFDAERWLCGSFLQGVYTLEKIIPNTSIVPYFHIAVVTAGEKISSLMVLKRALQTKEHKDIPIIEPGFGHTRTTCWVSEKKSRAQMT